MGGNQNSQPDPNDAGIARTILGSPVGVGLVLVLLPSVALFFGLARLEAVRLVGLPLLAIFGIVILFGTLALVAMFFKHLGLEDTKQPLALPEGSIRAAIALSLIVLFAIIAIMLFQGMDGKPFKLDGLTAEQRNTLAAKHGLRVEEIAEACAVAATPADACAEGDRRYIVFVRASPGLESVDMAKQLLVLVGTLMTSVTSYYFAARSVSSAERTGGEAARAMERGSGASDAGAAAAAPAATAPVAGSYAATAASADDDEHIDGCDVAITDATPDDELPPARGGVAPLGG